MLHLMKLAVGVRDPAHLRVLQAERAARTPPLRHRTRNFPRRAAEVIGGGSIYWVIAGFLSVRQPILDIVADCREDGSACAALILDPELVALAGRSVKPFQGWRYLASARRPARSGRVDPDPGRNGVAAGAAAGIAGLVSVVIASRESTGLCGGHHFCHITKGDEGRSWIPPSSRRPVTPLLGVHLVITSRRQLLAALGLALPVAVAGAVPALAASKHKPVHHIAHKRVAHHKPVHHPVTKKHG